MTEVYVCRNNAEVVTMLLGPGNALSHKERSHVDGFSKENRIKALKKRYSFKGLIEMEVQREGVREEASTIITKALLANKSSITRMQTAVRKHIISAKLIQQTYRRHIRRRNQRLTALHNHWHSLDESERGALKSKMRSNPHLSMIGTRGTTNFCKLTSLSNVSDTERKLTCIHLYNKRLRSGLCCPILDGDVVFECRQLLETLRKKWSSAHLRTLRGVIESGGENPSVECFTDSQYGKWSLAALNTVPVMSSALADISLSQVTVRGSPAQSLRRRFTAPTLCHLPKMKDPSTTASTKAYIDNVEKVVGYAAPRRRGTAHPFPPKTISGTRLSRSYHIHRPTN